MPLVTYLQTVLLFEHLPTQITLVPDTIMDMHVCLEAIRSGESSPTYMTGL